jgi:hypothetical protein
MRDALINLRLDMESKYFLELKNKNATHNDQLTHYGDLST